MTGGASAVSVGDVIAGRYRIESWLGQGHMAVVFRARHEGTGKACALKLVHSHLVTRQEFINLLLKEAQVGARIGQSPHIVDVFDAGLDPERQIPFLAMELLEGEALDRYIQSRGPLPASLVRVLLEQLGEALDQAHGAGVIHRDLKPANIFLTQNRRGQPVLKVVDFGIAKVLEQEAARMATQVGSPAYAAPEQLGPALRRMAAKQGISIAPSVSPATDVWAIGLLSYELLTGLVGGQYWAHFETLNDLIMRVALEEPEAASVRAGERANLLPAGFDAWMARCLRKNSSERWSTAGEAARALIELLDRATADIPTVRLSPAQWAEVPVGEHASRPQVAARTDASRMPAPVPATLERTQILAEDYLIPGAPSAHPPQTQSVLSHAGLAGTNPQAAMPAPRRIGVLVGAALLGLTVPLILLFILLPKEEKVSGSAQETVEAREDKTISPKAAGEPEAPAAPTSRVVDTGPTIASAQPESQVEMPVVQRRAEAPPASPTPPAPPTPSAEPPTPSAEPPTPSAAPTSVIDSMGLLHMNSIPVSKVVLDGRPLGGTPKVSVPVPEGMHTVTFITPTEKKTVKVYVKRGEIKTAAVRF